MKEALINHAFKFFNKNNRYWKISQIESLGGLRDRLFPLPLFAS